jgi:hypothetical protein
MGKNVKKKRPNFGGMADETITTPSEAEYTDTPTPAVTDTPTDEPPKKQESTLTDTRTPKYAPAHLPTMGSGERKTERLQLVVRPSTKARLANYARDHGTSSNEVVQRLLDELLDDAGY